MAGHLHHEPAAVCARLGIVESLDLLREPDNSRDLDAVRGEWRGWRMGYVPRGKNAALARALERGTVVRTCVRGLQPHSNPVRRIRFEAWIV